MTLRLALIMALLLGVAWAGPSVDALYRQADDRMAAHDYAGALSLYRQALEGQPTDVSLLLSASQAAEQCKQWDAAIGWLKTAHGLLPGDWRIEDRLLCDYQTSGDADRAEALVKDLTDRWRSKTDSVLSSNRRFPRGQVTDGSDVYDSYQGFDPDPSRLEHLYDFVSLDAQGDPRRIYYVRPEGSGWVFRMDDAQNQVTYRHATTCPSFREALAVFKQVWSGHLAPEVTQ